MLRRLALTFAVSVGASLFFAPPADAAPLISPQNPYRSFNISGVNYGSMQWERQHRSTRSGSSHRGFLFRRR